MEILIALISLAGVGITASAGVIVAIINTRKAGMEAANQNREEILAAIADVRKDLSANSRATVATTRSLISGIYEGYKDAKKLPEKTWRNILDLYEAYKGITIDGHTPNSWCDEIVEEMRTWEKV